MGKIKILFIIFLFTFASVVQSAAQKQPSRQDKNAWMKELQQVKNDYILKQLNLNHEQKAKFFPLYNKMEKEINKNSEETFKMARQVKEKGDKATDLEYEKAAEAMFESKAKEAAIEMKYYAEFKKILTPRQLFKLKRAERNFTKQLMKEHRKMKNEKGKHK